MLVHWCDQKKLKIFKINLIAQKSLWIIKKTITSLKKLASILKHFKKAKRKLKGIFSMGDKTRDLH